MQRQEDIRWGRWALWIGLGVLLRLLAVPPAVSDVDGVNFGRALLRFEPLQQAPHLPGYPVYVAAAKLASLLGAPEVWALTLPGILLGIVATLVLGFAVAGRWGAALAELTVVATSLLPGAVLQSAWPASDGLGLSLLTGAVGVALLPPSKNTARVVGVLAGLLLGVRLSWWPLVVVALLGLLWVERRTLTELAAPALVGLTVGVAAWLAPLLLQVDPVALASGSSAFAQGHFTAWGGALDGASSLPVRAGQMGWAASAGIVGVGERGPEGWLGLAMIPLTAIAVVGIGVAGATAEFERAAARAAAVAGLAFSAYFAWVWLGQNVDKPRHMLPFAIVAGLGLAVGLGRARIPAWILAAGLIGVSVPRARAQAELAPAASLVRHVVQHHRPEGLQIFAGEEARLFSHHAPSFRVWRPADPAVLLEAAARAHARGATVLITSSAPGLGQMQDELTLEARFSTSRVLRGHDYDMVLYRYSPNPRIEGRPHAAR